MSTTRRSFTGALTAAAYSRILGANDRIQLGFIGYGLIGVQHVHDFKQQADADLVAMCDVHQGRLDQGATACGQSVKTYRDFRKMLENKDIQGVVISTPDHWHALMSILSCAAGKDVYVEKPMTVFVQEGRWMVQAARKYNRVVQVGTQQRSGKHYYKAIDLMRNGAIGKVHSARLGFYRNVYPGFGAPPDSAPPSDLDYDLWLGPARAVPYNKNHVLYHFRWFWDYSGGQITNWGAHDLDIVQWMLNVKGPSAVASSGGRFALEDNGETPDTQDAFFEYPNMTAVWSHREASHGKAAGAGLTFYGTKGAMTVSRGFFEIFPDMHGAPENQIPQIMGHPSGGPQLRRDVKPEPWTQALKESSSNNLFASHARNFLDCIKSRQKPNADVEDGHRTVSACHLANISLRLKRRIQWDAEKEAIIGDKEASAHLVRPYRKPWDQALRSAL